MVKSLENGTSLPPFLVKCYEMVNDESTNELISWTESNDSFIISDESKFSSQLLPKYFKHSNFSSFVRQLNIYGFRKIDTDRWQFANEAFIKGQKHLLKNITRRKQPQSVIQKKSSQEKEQDPAPPSPSEEEDKKIALWKEVENLKTDKTALTQELKKLRQHQETSQSKMLLLREQLKGMEKNQQQMLSFIVMAMQSSEFMVQFFQPKENSWQTGNNNSNKLSEVIDDFETTPSDRRIVKYQPQVGSTREEATSNSDEFMELGYTSDEMRDLLVDIDFLLCPMEEKLLSLENDHLVLPDMSENDTMMEQVLLEIPEAEVNTKNGSDDDDDLNEIENFEGEIDTSEKVEVLTKQMGFLTSEIRSEN